MALVRFINADPSRQSVTAYMDSSVAFSDVSFKTVTPYRQVPDGNHTFHLGDRANMQAGRDTDVDVRTGQGNEGVGVDVNRNRDNDDMRGESESLGGGNYYTVVLRPPSADERDDDNRNAARGPRFEVIKDDFGSPKDDQAQVRVINAATYPEKLDIYMRPKNDELFGNIDVTSTPSYKDVDPGNITLEIRQDDRDRALFTLPSHRVEAGKMYTIVLTNKGTNARNIDAVIVEDQYLQRRDGNQGGMDGDDNEGMLDHDNDKRDNDRDRSSY